MMTTVAAILFAAACVPESADDESGNGYPTAGSETTDNEDGDAPVDDEPDVPPVDDEPDEPAEPDEPVIDEPDEPDPDPPPAADPVTIEGRLLSGPTAADEAVWDVSGPAHHGSCESETDDTLWIWLFGNDDTQPQDFVGVMAPERPARQVGVELYTLDGSAQSGMTIIVDTEMGELLPLDNFPHFGGTGFTGGAGICENGNLLLFGRMAGSFDTIGGTRYVPIVDNPDFGDGLTGSTFITLAPAGTGNVVIRPEMSFDWSPDPAAGVGCGAVSFGPDQLPFAAELFDTILTY